MSEPRLKGYDCVCQGCRHHADKHHAGVTDENGVYVTEDGKGPNYCLVEGCTCTDLVLPADAGYDGRGTA